MLIINLSLLNSNGSYIVKKCGIAATFLGRFASNRKVSNFKKEDKYVSDNYSYY